jgi:hypothetical protein
MTNYTKISDITTASRVNTAIMGKGTALEIVKVEKAGYGFPQPGIYAIVAWDNTIHKTGFDEDGYAVSPVLIDDD